jgi:pimeloyl-ACP methyl ester carboxylesterase
MKLVLEDPELDYQVQRSLAKTDFGMANAGECMRIAAEIAEGGFDAWQPTFSSFAGRLRERADAAAAADHPATARSAYLRACEYYRNAFFFLRGHLDDEHVLGNFRASRECFLSATGLHDHPLLPLGSTDGSVPWSGYLGLPGEEGPYPLLLAPGGYDSTAEELYPTLAAGVARGYAVLIFDGPGQGRMLYERRVPMRPDWENVIPPVLDEILQLPELDPDRVALLGRSFGGYLCPRAASGEHRLAALIADPGQYDLGAALKQRLPDDLLPLLDEDSERAESAFAALLADDSMRRLFEPRMTVHGTGSVREYCRMLLEYSNEGHADAIRCPTLICDNETDPISTMQGRLLYEQLTCPKEFIRFTAAEGADGHCEGMGAIVFYERAFDWLDETLRGGRSWTEVGPVTG